MDDVTFIAMELIEGQNLGDLLARGQLPLSRALALLVEIADALSRAHEKGIVHRDLKPANIMVTEDGHAKIIDFGLAKLLEPPGDASSKMATAVKINRGDTRDGQVMGTLSYMSPEQARGQTVDHRTDIFSFGIVLHEMLTGELPFKAASSAEMPHAIIHNASAPLGAAVSGVSARELERIADKCLAKDPEERYQTAKDLFIDLRRVKRDSQSEPSVDRAGEPGPELGSGSRRWLIPGLATGLAVVVVSALLFRDRAPDTRLPRIARTFQLTHEPGLEVDPVISPDGKMVAYAKGPLGATKIYVQQVAGGRPVPLTQDFPGAHYRPAWSPDGSQVAFSSRNDGRSDTYVVAALGGAPRRIVEHSAELVWSPGGQEVAYARTGPGPTREVLTRSFEGGQPSRIVEQNGTSLSWSPGGDKIVYVQGNSSYLLVGGRIANLAPSSLWTVSAEGGDPVRVTEDVYLNHSPVWAPDERHVLFVSNRGGSRDIYRIPLDASGARTGEPERLTTGLNVHSLSLSEDGKTLSYSVLTTKQNIWSIPIPEEGAVSVTEAAPVTTGSQTIEGIHVSPDGQWLVFDSNRSGNQDVYKMPLEGGELVQLTTDPAEDFLPAWSPDMKEIVFYSFRTGNRDIFVMSAEGGTPRQLTNDPGRDHYPDWSPDGQAIAFQSSRSGQYEVYALSMEKDELSGGASQPLTSAGGNLPKWSPDGAFIAFTTGSDVSVVPAEGGEVRILAKAVGYSNQAWSSDAQTVYYKPGSSIWSVPASGGDPKLLVRFDDPERRSIRYEWAVGAGRFFFTLTEHESDIWVMELE